MGIKHAVNRIAALEPSHRVTDLGFLHLAVTQCRKAASSLEKIERLLKEIQESSQDQEVLRKVDLALRELNR